MNHNGAVIRDRKIEQRIDRCRRSLPADQHSNNPRDGDVIKENHGGDPNDVSLATDKTDDGAGRDDIVDTYGVAGRAANGLQRDDPDRIRADILPDLKLKQREHHVADRVAAGDEGPQSADQR